MRGRSTLLIFISLFILTFSYYVQANAQSNYKGWQFVASKLKKDGIPEGLLRAVYEGEKEDTVVPAFDFVPFKLRPQETSVMYRSFHTSKMLKLADACYIQHKNHFDKAGKFFGIPPRLLVAFLSVETHCGKFFGSDLVVNRLSRVVSTGVETNVKRNYIFVLKDIPTATLDDLFLRAKYLEQVFYPHLLALFESHLRGELNLFTLRGSSAGAFGYPQFLPKTYQDYAIDGDQDGKIDLFTPADAIFSVGNFLKEHGWKSELSTEKKRQIIWNYNRSEPYIDAILFLSRL